MKKTKMKLFSILLIVWGLAMLPSVTFAWTGNGSGTKEDPYQITNREELDQISAVQPIFDDGYKLYFKLMNDIDLENNEFTPIDFKFKTPFTRLYFDGNHKIISGLVINVKDQNAGLFVRFLWGGEIKNLGVQLGKKGITVTSTTDKVYRIGGIVGEMGISFSEEIAITNCYVISDEDSKGIESSGWVGGIVGKMSNVRENGFPGAISVNNCYSSCKLSGKTVGGIIGEFYCDGFDSITNCYSDCELSGETVGGIIGRLFSRMGCSVTNCFALGSIHSTADVGGIVGSCEARRGYSHGGSYGEIKIFNCIALNLDGITCQGNNKGRVAGVIIIGDEGCDVTLKNNYACAGIKINDNYVPQGSESNQNGEDLTTENFVGNNTGAFKNWDSNWLFDPANENLPILASISTEQQPIANIKRKDFIFVGVGNKTTQADKTKVWSLEGTLHIQTTEAKRAYIFDLDGVLRNELTISAGENSIQLPKGGYIVKLNSKYHKITVK